MQTIYRTLRAGIAAAALLATGACANAGGLGSVLGSVLGQGQGNQLQGTVSTVDTRSQQVGIQQSNGQVVYVSYDANTQVTYQNQRYQVANLERGDQVTARVQANGNSYYTDLIQVDQSVSSNTGGGVYGGQNAQVVQGTVRQINGSDGWFVVDTNNGYRYTVTLSSNVSRNDVSRFNSLRTGDVVRFYAVPINNSTLQLTQFY